MAKKQSKTKKNENSGLPNETREESKLFTNIKKTVLQYVQGKSYQPSTLGELRTKLHLPDQHVELLSHVLSSLIKQGILEVIRGKFNCTKLKPSLIVGILRLHPRGFGFVKPENATLETEDIFIPKHLTKNAVDGDTVEVIINTDSVSEKGPEGRVASIVTRARTHLAGIIQSASQRDGYLAYAPLLGSNQNVVVMTDSKTLLNVGDRVMLEIMEWGDRDSPAICKLVKTIGHISDPSCDIPAALEEFELRKEFPTKAIEEAQKYGTRVPLSEIKKRQDLRNLTCFTIDPDTAKDFDDAISLTKDSQGHFHLGVHIADVSHYVHTGTSLDIEAQLRCNSTYFPGYCLPMLPKELSDNLCSLKPNVNRLTASVLMEFDPEGTLVNYTMARSVIKSAKRFTYKEAKAVLDGKKSSPHADTLKLMVDLCGLLKQKRYERGSVEFGLPELVILVDKSSGVPTGTDYVVYDITHQLVEEFMLKANEIVAWHLTNQGKHLTYRVHDEPAEESMRDFAILAGAFGFDLPSEPTPRDIQKLFDEAMNTPNGQYLASSYIRRMRLAIYSSDNIGHYGLSLEHYCHFTSPIRRYVDLVAHRLLFGENEEKAKLEMIAARCSDQERISAKAEGRVVLLKKLRLLKAQQQASPYKQYEALVTRVKNFGVTFEIPDFMLEGYAHVSELGDDYYVFDEASATLTGRHQGHIYRAGDKITVMPREINLILLDSKWDIIPEHADNELSFIRKKRLQQSQSKGKIQKKPNKRHSPKPQLSRGKPSKRKRKAR